MKYLALLALLAPVSGGCSRDPAESLCPDVAPGELVVTEVRGPQDPAAGPWIELYNASGAAVDLEGMKVRFRKRDGSGESAVLVRRSTVVAAGDYAVLGLFTDAARPDHIDYGFAVDYVGTWLSGAAIDVETCGARVDRADYDSLPATGTYAFGGAPDAERNDLPASWCTDAVGSPGAANPACP